MSNEEDIIYYKITFNSDIDFFAEQIKIYIQIPKHYLKEKQLEVKNNSDDEPIETINFNRESHLIVNEKFKILEDYNAVIVREKTYLIPDFFNKKMVKNCDTKTWEMIFYQIFAGEISQNVQKFKEIFCEK